MDYTTFFNSVIRRKDWIGRQLADSHEIDRLWQLSGNGDDLLFLLNYKEENMNSFPPRILIHYLENGYSTSDILTLLNLTDPYGKRLGETIHILDFVNTRGNVEEAVKVAQLLDSEGKVVFRDDHEQFGYEGGLDGIATLLKHGGNAQKVTELTSILDDQGVSVFRTPRDIMRFLESGGKPDYAREMLDIRDHEGKLIFNEYSIGLWKECGRTAQEAREIAGLKDSSGQVVFTSGEDIISLPRTNLSFRQIKNFTDLKDRDGCSIFRDGKDILDFVNSKGKISEAREYIQYGNSLTEPFKGFDLALLRSMGVPPHFAFRMAERGFNANTSVYYYNLGLSEDDTEWSNNGKPKVFVGYTVSDPPDIFNIHSFYGEDTFEFLAHIKRGYDFKLRAVRSSTEIYREQVSDAKLTIIGGHGQPDELILSMDRPKYRIKADPLTSKIAIGDIGLRSFLGTLPIDSTFYLDSCLTAYGGPGADNLANYAADCAPGRTIIASMGCHRASSTKILRLYPLELEITDVRRYLDNDVTYVVRK